MKISSGFHVFLFRFPKLSQIALFTMSQNRLIFYSESQCIVNSVYFKEFETIQILSCQ